MFLEQLLRISLIPVSKKGPKTGPQSPNRQIRRYQTNSPPPLRVDFGQSQGGGGVSHAIWPKSGPPFGRFPLTNRHFGPPKCPKFSPAAGLRGCFTLTNRPLGKKYAKFFAPAARFTLTKQLSGARSAPKFFGPHFDQISDRGGGVSQGDIP